jgi:hypothetical protein
MAMTISAAPVLLVAGRWLLAAGRWPLAAGRWLLAGPKVCPSWGGRLRCGVMPVLADRVGVTLACPASSGSWRRWRPGVAALGAG